MTNAPRIVLGVKPSMRWWCILAAITLLGFQPTTLLSSDEKAAVPSAFPTTFTVTSYSTETPETGELQGNYIRKGDAEKEAARLRSLPYIARVDIEVDLAPTDEFSAKSQRLVGTIKKAIEEKATYCNVLVKSVAEGFHKDSGLKGTADEMLKFLGSKDAEKKGWIDLNAQANHDKSDAAELAVRMANQGMLVVGAISTTELNDNKPLKRDAYKTGHVFVVVPSPESGWHGGMIANAGTGVTKEEQTARVLLLNWATTEWQRPLYHFYAIKGDE